MSWTKITCFFAFCALLAAPVMADPTLDVSLNPGGGNPTIGPNGGLVWSIGVDLDESLYTDTGSPTEGRGGSAAIDVAFELTGLAAAATTVDGTNAPNGFVGLSADGFSLDGNEGVVIDTVDSSQVYAGLGTTFFESAETSNIVDVHHLFTIETAVLTVTNPTSTIAWGGMYDANGDEGGTTHGGLSQEEIAAPLDSQFGVMGSITYTAHPGDANLDGTTDFADFGIIQNNYNQSGKNWASGDFNGDGNTDFADFGILQNNYNTSGGGFSVVAGSVTVPEPSTVVLLGTVALLGVAACRRKIAK